MNPWVKALLRVLLGSGAALLTATLMDTGYTIIAPFVVVLTIVAVLMAWREDKAERSTT